MRRILVPTDFSVTASAAFRPAAELARTYGAGITVIYVLDRLTYNTGYPYLDLTAYQGRLEALATSSLERAVAQLKELGAERVESVFRIGTPHVEVLREARTSGADLLVVATHGLSGFRRFILGSTAERVVRKAACPVLTVHAEDPHRPFQVRRILFPTDLSATAAEALPYAAALARKVGAQLELLHVFEDPTQSPPMGPGYLLPSSDEVQKYRDTCVQDLEQLAAKLETGEHRATWRVIEQEQPAEAIVQHAREAGFDLIVTPSHGRRGLEHMFLGSVAERVVRLAEVPVVVVKPSQFSISVPALDIEREEA
jgi:nucleotide-binding universal stress UspA family protein